MLHYRRRNSTEPAPRQRMHRHPLLTLVNWSYDRRRHLDEERLREILSRFDERYAHIYLRIFNEVPAEVLWSFVAENGLDESDIENIYNRMHRFGVDLRPLR